MFTAAPPGEQTLTILPLAPRPTQHGFWLSFWSTGGILFPTYPAYLPSIPLSATWGRARWGLTNPTLVIIIIINCKWIDTRCQQYSTHLHTNSTQNIQNGKYTTIFKKL
jgi:hypothetical protein